MTELDLYRGSRIRGLVRRLQAAGVPGKAFEWGPTVTTALLAVFGGLTALSATVGLGLLFGGAVLFLFAEALARSYRGEQEDKLQALTLQIKDLAALNRDYIGTMNSNLASILAEILRKLELRKKDKRALGKSAYNKELERRQQGLLLHCVQTLSDLGDIERRLLSANWTLRHGDVFSVVVYERDHVERTPGVAHPITDGAPGASRAFLSGDASLVKNVADEACKEYFSPDARYKTILSIPVKIEANQVSGVVNIDGEVPGILRLEDSALILDAVYAIGLLEQLKEADP